MTVDVGWTPQRLVLPHARTLAKAGGTIISLLKPHYEARPEERKGGKVRDGCDAAIVARTLEDLAALGIEVAQVAESPLTGGKAKNKEFLLRVRT